VATACSNPPKGRARWTLELLAGEMVKLTAHESLSRETVRRRMADADLKPWRRKMWCIPQVDADYVARMEDVLDLYAEAPALQRPVVCFDESPIQLIGEVHRPIAPEPGQIERYDCEYQRNGTANLFVLPRCPPGAGSRSPRAVRRRTSLSACANSPIPIIRRPSASAWFSTIVNGPRNLLTLGRANFPSWRVMAISRRRDHDLRFGRLAAAFGRRLNSRRLDECLGADMLRDEFGVLATVSSQCRN